MNWTDERVERLKKLWADGLSASQIAAQLGGVSRNAVIGKVHRLNPAGARQDRRTRRRCAPSARPPRPRAPNYAGRTAPATRPQPLGGTRAQAGDLDVVAVEEIDTPARSRTWWCRFRAGFAGRLSERTCKWPIGDPLQEGFHFCGNDSGEARPIAATMPGWPSSLPASAGASGSLLRQQVRRVRRALSPPPGVSAARPPRQSSPASPRKREDRRGSGSLSTPAAVHGAAAVSFSRRTRPSPLSTARRRLVLPLCPRSSLARRHSRAAAFFSRRTGAAPAAAMAGLIAFAGTVFPGPRPRFPASAGFFRADGRGKCCRFIPALSARAILRLPLPLGSIRETSGCR